MDADFRSSKALEEVLRLREGSVPDFLYDVFECLAKRTDFYHVSSGPDDAKGFSPGVAEKILFTIYNNCNPNFKMEEGPECVKTTENKPILKNKIFLPAAIAQEVEVTTSQEQDVESFLVDIEDANVTNEEEIMDSNQINSEIEKGPLCSDDPSNHLKMQSLKINKENYEKKVTPKIDEKKSCNKILNTVSSQVSKEMPKNGNAECDSFNGAIRDNFCWSQSITELDVTVNLPSGISSSKQLKINTTSDSITVQYLLTGSNEWSYLINDKFTYKIKAAETVWVMSEGRVRITLEKQVERWWNSLLETEPKIDTSTLNCSRPLHELSDDHIAKVRELQWNHMQKLAGKPTSDQLKQEGMLKKAWDAPGSPFTNMPYDPRVLT